MAWNPDIFASSDVLITGGLGFIGSALARRLVELGAKVTLVDSLIPEYGGNLFNIHDIRDRVTVDLTDVRDSVAMSSLIRKRQFLFNLAGQTSHLDSMRVVHQPIKNAISECWIADLLVPPRDRQLRG